MVYTLIQYIACLVLIVFSNIPTVRAEAIMYFKYGVFVTQSDGSSLPNDSVPYSTITDGIRVTIYNGLPIPDRFMLIFELNGHVLEFSTEPSQNVRQFISKIEPMGSVEVIIKLDIKEMADNTDNILHIICVGILDSLPKDEWNTITSFSHVISIPINGIGFKGKIETINFLTPQSFPDAEMADNTVRLLPGVTFGSNRTPAIQLLNDKNVDVPLAINAVNDLSVLLMLNHQFVTICEKEAIIVQGGTGKLYRQIVNLSLEGKENQLYSICLPLQKGIPAVFSTSDKILMILE